MIPADASVQLDLFADHVALLNGGRRALAEFEIETALAQFAAVLATWPSHADAQAAHQRASAMCRMLSERTQERGDIAEALLDLHEQVDPALRPALHRRLAREAERKQGGGARIRGEPFGFFALLGGDLAMAERLLRESLFAQPADARARAYLADVLHQYGMHDDSRSEYLRALVDDAHAVAFDRICDPMVAILPLTAEEFDVAGPSIRWAAAVGVVTGVFRAPTELRGIGLYDDATRNRNDEGILFFRALLEEQRAESFDDRVELRRRMKKLCPALLARHLQR